MALSYKITFVFKLIFSVILYKPNNFNFNWILKMPIRERRYTSTSTSNLTVEIEVPIKLLPEVLQFIEYLHYKKRIEESKKKN